VQAGSQQAAEELLARLHPQGFDYFLARAALESAKGHRDEAYKFVTRARYARPHTEGRPLLTQYTFGDFVELLFEQSGDPRLRDLALSWAQVFQKIEPWQSWSYAIEARLGKTEADRGKAMAMTRYLDPESERLSRVKRQDVERAVKVWGAAQPFVLERSQPSGRPEKI
ncbi:MAG: hypothetical protein OEW36_11770, partial [Hylemonella sp.]|nr:hypothetical protein [Hylemonella sp.]